MTNQEFADQIIRAAAQLGVCELKFRDKGNFNKCYRQYKKYMNFIDRFVLKHRNERNE